MQINFAFNDLEMVITDNLGNKTLQIILVYTIAYNIIHSRRDKRYHDYLG